MAYYFPSVDPIYILRRAGTNEDPFILIQEDKRVKNKVVTMIEIPSFTHDVNVTAEDGELNEVDSDVLTQSQFRIDYSTGMAHFHSSLEGKKVTIGYQGTGYVDIPTNRIRMPGEDGDPLETLQDTLERVSEGIDTLEQVGELRFVGEYEPDYSYKKWNFVSYQGRSYVAVENVVGESPSESQKWEIVSSSISFSGKFSSGKTYTSGEVVSDENGKNLFLSKIANNTLPLNDEDGWEVLLTLDDTVEEIEATIQGKFNQLEQLEQQLESSDEERDDNELERDATILDRLSSLDLAEQDFQDNESTRESNENERQSNEATRQSSESDREDAETTRVSNEVSRVTNETERGQRVEMLVSDTETAIGEAEEVVAEFNEIKGEVDTLVSTTQDNVNATEQYTEELLEWRHLGDYDSSTSYVRYNVVSYDGSAYMAIQDSFGVAPQSESEESEESWGLVSLRGKDGLAITIEGNSVDEDGDINLSGLGLVREDVLETEIEEVNSKIGIISELKTIRKGNVVEAINELKSTIDDIIDIMS